MKPSLREAQRFILRLVFFCLIVFVSFEIAVRFIGDYDSIGQFRVQNIKVPPYVINYEAIERTARAMQRDNPNRRIIYDPFTGFTPNPNYQSGNGLDIYNTQGIRVPSPETIYDAHPEDGVLRIALFGDSNVAGGPLPYEKTWGYILQESLKAQGIAAEVINFGVQGYWPAQSEQRWEHVGREFHPDLVIFGSQIYNIEQSTNLYSGFLLPTNSATFAPMFYLEGDNLRLVNSPVPPPDETATILRNFEQSPLSEYEQHEPHYPFWYKSHFLGLMAYAFNFSNTDYYQPNSIHMRTYTALVDTFAEDVTEHDATFFYMHITTEHTLLFKNNDGTMPYQSALDDIAANHHYIETLDLFPVIQREDWKASHYSATASIRVGEHVANTLAECLADGTCTPPRMK